MRTTHQENQDWYYPYGQETYPRYGEGTDVVLSSIIMNRTVRVPNSLQSIYDDGFDIRRCPKHRHHRHTSSRVSDMLIISYFNFFSGKSVQEESVLTASENKSVMNTRTIPTVETGLNPTSTVIFYAGVPNCVAVQVAMSLS